MAKSKLTGPGQGERRPGYPPSTLLFNFDVGGIGLKAVHCDFLKMYVEPVLKSEGSVSIVGLASRTGSTQFNQHLSHERAVRTLAYLRLQVRTNFNVRTVVGYGEMRAALEGERDGQEDPRFRSVILYTSDNPNPPTPPARVDLTPLFDRSVLPGRDHADDISKVIDITGMLLSLLEYAPVVGELASMGGGILNIVTGVAGMPLLWWSLKWQNEANGKLQGFWQAIQDMAKAYSDPHLADVGLAQWPALPTPHAHPFSAPANLLSVNEKEWMDGRRAGCASAHGSLKTMEAKDPGSGRKMLFRAYQGYGEGLADAIQNSYERILIARGKGGWPITG